ncbi:endonuclease domain-containing protein [Sphingomonas sp. PAMC 26621]|uniref:endonuclease domain-containing protein n=1 Tax=Sphingomonas sp. PAMC 26621 TaxID=1112213 RepID=UPI001EE68C24|nr:endonuclease domain-containing protein [Sphingomonas sp. PAMC 26621]
MNSAPRCSGHAGGMTDPALGWGGAVRATEAELLARAHEMRRNPTEPEVRLWRALSNSQLNGLKFRRQHVVFEAQAILDFFCPAIGLGVEVDGDTHDGPVDEKRDVRLRALGFTIIRFGNPDVMTNLAGVAEIIAATASTLPGRWQRTAPPQPLP